MNISQTIGLKANGITDLKSLQRLIKIETQTAITNRLGNGARITRMTVAAFTIEMTQETHTAVASRVKITHTVLHMMVETRV